MSSLVGRPPSDGRADPMRVLFVAKDAFYLRNFESLLRALCARGHRVHVAFENEPAPEFRQGLVEVLESALPTFSTGPVPKRGSRRWRRTSDELRRSLDYLPYLHPRYDAAPSLRARAAALAPRVVRRMTSGRALRAPGGLEWLDRLLSLVERGVPTSRTLARFIGDHGADVVVVSPLLQLGSRQADVLRAARRLGLPTCFCAYSWDNLTTKGRIRGAPDLVTVWNELQRWEAIELHGVEPDRVVAAGASAYDHWFGWRPRTSREEFCATVGLTPDRPYVLYVGSALLSGDETAFVRTWVEGLRGSPRTTLERAGILVRPHPQRPLDAERLDLTGQPNAALWPPPGARALGLEARAALFDSIFHAAAVVGLNTSAFIDAAIIGRPSLAILPPEFRDSQEGTLHFRYLREAGGGLLTVAGSLEEHADQLAETLAASDRRPVRGERFVEAFVRPRGVDVAATGALVEAIEAQAAAGPRPVRRRLVEETVGFVLAAGLSEVLRWREERVPRRAARRARRLGRRHWKRLRRIRKRVRRLSTTPQRPEAGRRRSAAPSGSRGGRWPAPRRS